LFLPFYEPLLTGIQNGATKMCFSSIDLSARNASRLAPIIVINIIIIIINFMAIGERFV